MEVVRQLIAVAVVLLLLWLALRLVRRNGGAGLLTARSSARIGSLEQRGKLALGPQHAVHIVRAQGRELILGVHPGGITLLGEIGPGSQETSGEAEGRP